MQNLKNRLGVIGELFAFLWQRKQWWLAPMVLILLVFGILVVVAGGSSLVPFLYPLF